MSLHEIRLRINGTDYTGRAEARKTLADFIREDCGLTGTHLGCEHGVCGACTILMDGEAVRSCLLFAVQADGADLMTVEGLADGDRLHPIQQAYWEHHALQCGFCTPGFLMTTLAFLRDHPSPTEQEIREGLAGNLCRCTGYQNIVKAVAAVAGHLASGARAGFFPPQARRTRPVEAIEAVWDTDHACDSGGAPREGVPSVPDPKAPSASESPRRAQGDGAASAKTTARSRKPAAAGSKTGRRRTGRPRRSPPR
jgi:carbon-monoxide dehydrogenase small subunit